MCILISKVSNFWSSVENYYFIHYYFSLLFEKRRWWKCSMIHVKILQNITYDTLSFSLLCRSTTIFIFTSYSATKIRALFLLRCNTRFSILVVLRTNNIAERKIVVRHWENFRSFLMKVMRLKTVRSLFRFILFPRLFNLVLSVVMTVWRGFRCHDQFCFFFQLLGFFIKLWEPWISRKYRDVLTLQADREE